MDTMIPRLLISSISDFSIVGKSILNSKELLPLPWFLEPLFILISSPSLSWLMCLPRFFIFLQLLRSVFLLVLFLLYWAHALPYLLSDMFETLTLHCFYCILGYNYYIPVKQLWCTVYIYACNRRLKRAWYDELKSSFSCLGIITSIISFPLIISTDATSSRF